MHLPILPAADRILFPKTADRLALRRAFALYEAVRSRAGVAIDTVRRSRRYGTKPRRRLDSDDALPLCLHCYFCQYRLQVNFSKVRPAFWWRRREYQGNDVY